MSGLIRQVFDQAPATPPKRLFPVIRVKRNNEELDIAVIPNLSITKSKDNIGDSFSMSFMGQDEFEYLEPLLATNEYTVTTGYIQSGGEKTNVQVAGVPSGRNQKLVYNELITSGNFVNGVRKLMSPFAQRITVDIFRSNRTARETWDSTLPLEEYSGITTCSALISLILSQSGAGIGLSYAAFDYPISSYQRTGYPLDIIKDLVEFIGAYMIFDYANNVLEIKDGLLYPSGNYDFLYVDNGDIVELSYDSKGNEIVNAVMIKGILPDDAPEYKDMEKDSQKTEDKTAEDKMSGSDYGSDDQVYLVDKVQGKQVAPDDPYRKEIPEDLIEQKFYNNYLNFDVDSSSLTVEGGAWNDKDQKYENAKILGYGGMVPASAVLTTDVNAPAGKLPMAQDLMPGEGKVGFPWNYEENTNDGTGQNLNLEDAVYRSMSLKGKVVNSIPPSDPITGANVSVTFAGTDNIWQYWRNVANKSLVLFYMPDNSVGDILGEGWENVTSSYPSMEPPSGFPKTGISGRGPKGYSESGVFTFANLPLSEYDIKVDCVGFDEGDLKVNLDPTTFDFLKSGKDTKNPNSKYKLLDTSYYCVIYGKKAKPISFGFPVASTTGDSKDQYTEDSKVTPIKPNRNISIDLRCSRGIELAGGRLLYASPITDSRIINDFIAIKAGSAVLINTLAKREMVDLKLPHNPWLEKGQRIAVQSYVKGWTGINIKSFIVEDISISYGVSDGGQEELYDVVKGAKGL